MVLLHGFIDCWRTWDLVIPELEKHHDVLAPALVGHAGGPPLTGEVTKDLLPDAIERAMDEAGFETAHIVGNSLGGYLALQLAVRGRARSVVALAPAGGWVKGDFSYRESLDFFPALQQQVKAIAPRAEELLQSSEGKRRATLFTTVNYEHIPAELLAHQTRAVAACDGVVPMTEYAKREGYSLDAEKIDCPVRVVWGTGGQAAAVAVRGDPLPRGLAAARRLGRARRRRALPAARRPARDRPADPRLHDLGRGEVRLDEPVPLRLGRPERRQGGACEPLGLPNSRRRPARPPDVPTAASRRRRARCPSPSARR
jgi:pimeloyl-ACP methyl ester carboxylesterase